MCKFSCIEVNISRTRQDQEEKTKNTRKSKVHQHKQMSKAKKKKKKGIKRNKEERKGKTITPTASFSPLLMAMGVPFNFFVNMGACVSLLIRVPGCLIFYCLHLRNTSCFPQREGHKLGSTLGFLTAAKICYEVMQQE